MAVKRRTPFKLEHDLEYGLQVSTRDNRNCAVESVACQFHISFGREDSVRQKRKKSSYTRYFRIRFRVDQYKQYLEGQHKTRWKEYQTLFKESKKPYFDVVPFASSTTSHFSGGIDQQFFIIGAPIVDVVLQRLLFKPDSDEHASDSVLKLFDPLFNAENRDLVTEYGAIIENAKLCNIVVRMVAFGFFFSACFATSSLHERRASTWISW